jgi:hypothetical protein
MFKWFIAGLISLLLLSLAVYCTLEAIKAVFPMHDSLKGIWLK